MLYRFRQDVPDRFAHPNLGERVGGYIPSRWVVLIAYSIQPTLANFARCRCRLCDGRCSLFTNYPVIDRTTIGRLIMSRPSTTLIQLTASHFMAIL